MRTSQANNALGGIFFFEEERRSPKEELFPINTSHLAYHLSPTTVVLTYLIGKSGSCYLSTHAFNRYSI